jgi:hypothetical protein
LFFAFYTVTVCPTVTLAASSLKASCESKCTMNKEESCPISDSDCCPIEMCKSCQCCFCAFACPVESKTIKIQLFQSDLQTQSISDAFPASDFTSDCWQPPEFL